MLLQPCRSSRCGLWLCLLLLAPLLVACGSASSSGDRPITWHAADTITPTAAPASPPAIVATPPGEASGGVADEAATGSTPVASAAIPISAADLKAHQPNELGMIPILQYHIITTNPEEVGQFARLAADLRADLQWLYDHNFYVVTLREVVANAITAPAGKHPVVLTFDDATSGQFRFIEDDEGELVPDPKSAVGILEAFFAEHPDFGHTAHFAVLPYNCFAVPDADQMPYCHEKIQWLADHGYEIGNHTYGHANLYDIPNDEFIAELSKPMQWVHELIGDHPANATDLLTLPYGMAPDKDLHADQRRMMRDGWTYEGESFVLQGALLVGANPAHSPASTEWYPMWIPRIQCFDEELDKWFGAMASGAVPLYVSDGDPETITVPEPLPNALADQLDTEALADAGKLVVRYDPKTGTRTDEQAVGPTGR